jgi:nucleoside-diphosphate-sugar epimerase
MRDQKRNQTVVVTGAAGYLGAVLCQRLLSKGFRVRGIDSLRYHGDALLGLLGWPRFEFFCVDVRDTARVSTILEGADAVVHLAALVGEPACQRSPEEAREINHITVPALARLCLEHGIERFVFTSTCSNYGKSDADRALTEDDPLQPLSLYSETKIAAERDLLALRNDHFRPVILRLATLFGVSPAMRFDLLVQEFVREAACRSELVVYGADAWRPLLHVSDAAEAIQRVLVSGVKAGDGVYNVGDERLNYRKGDLARLVVEACPAARLTLTDGVSDPRDYRVSFTKFKQDYDFVASHDLRAGVLEIKKLIDDGIVGDPYGPRYKG